MPTFISQIIQQHPDAGYWHQQYPWFSIGRLVDAANKMETPAFAESAQRTAIYFNDIPRLHWLLHQPEVAIVALQALVIPEIKTSYAAAQTPVIEVAATPVAEEVLIANKADETIPELIEYPQAFLQTNAAAEIANDIKIQTPTENQNTVQPVADSHKPPQSFKNNSTDDAIADVTNPEEPEDAEIEEPESVLLPTSILSESLAQAADSYKNDSLNEDVLVFKTAYQHTIDYFASQGIKLDSEPAKDDRFGQQLKTFTSWLRQMKPLPGTPVPEADPLVESHAAHSLQKGEVVTEPMADVLLKQGKTSHALAVLEKLRLLHPQKSHYFAARIQQIKDI